MSDDLDSSINPEKLNINHICFVNGIEILGVVIEKKKSKYYILEPIKIYEYTDIDDNGNIEAYTSFAEYDKFSDEPIFEFDKKDILSMSIANNQFKNTYIDVVAALEVQRKSKIRKEKKKNKKSKKEIPNTSTNVICFKTAKEKLSNNL